MTFRNSVEVDMAPANVVGVAVKSTDPDRGHMHVGLLYDDPEGAPHMLHLAFHHDLRKEPPPNRDEYLWDDCAWLAAPRMRANAELIADFIETCALNTEIDYGFSAPDDAFDADGKYDALDPSKGLTCATFIAAVFKSAGFPTVKLETWPSRPDDEAWQQSVLRLLRRFAPERAAQLSGAEVAYRLKPSELAVASASSRAPLCFARAVRLAAQLEANLVAAARNPRGAPAPEGSGDPTTG